MCKKLYVFYGRRSGREAATCLTSSPKPWKPPKLNAYAMSAPRRGSVPSI